MNPIGLFVTLTFGFCLVAADHLVYYQEGYNATNLPEGGWGGWWSVDGPSGNGDFEYASQVKNRYGSGCGGLACDLNDIYAVSARTKSRHSSDMQAHKTPSEMGDVVTMGMWGFQCKNSDQVGYNPGNPDAAICDDYEVQYYCKDCGACCQKITKKMQEEKEKNLLKRILDALEEM